MTEASAPEFIHLCISKLLIHESLRYSTQWGLYPNLLRSSIAIIQLLLSRQWLPLHVCKTQGVELDGGCCFWLLDLACSLGSMVCFPTGSFSSSAQLFSLKSLYEMCYSPFFTTRDIAARPSKPGSRYCGSPRWWQQTVTACSLSYCRLSGTWSSEVEDMAFWSAGTATALQAGEPAATRDSAQAFSSSHVTPGVHFRTMWKSEFLWEEESSWQNRREKFCTLA